MSGYTKTGLLLLMVAVIFMFFTILATYSFYSSFRPTDIQEQNYSFLFSMIPLAMLGGVGGLLTLIGALFVLVGRKEFGEQHRKFIIYALIVFIVAGFISIYGTLMRLFMNMFESSTIWPLAQSFILSVLYGLIWVLALYHLENKKGRTILLAAFVFMILIATVTIMSTLLNIIAWNNQGSLYNLTGQSFSSSQSQSVIPWIGPAGFILLLCYLGEYVLLFIALYIPYQRISRGALQPVHPEGKAQIMCPTCGRTIPYDSINCPYCGTHL